MPHADQQKHQHKVRQQYAKVDADQCVEDTSVAEKSITPLPVTQLLVLCLVQTCDAINYFQVFPYLAFMVLDMGMVDNINHVGQYAGYLASAYAFASLLSAYAWGVVADKYGRRFALISGLLGTILCTLMFGLSRSFWWAVTWRGCWGLLNGNLGVVKTYIAEVTDGTNRAKALLYLGICGGAGRIAGPTIGGFLARPQFGGPVFERYFPYLLPNLLCALLSAFGAISGYFLLPETLDPLPPALCPTEGCQLILLCRRCKSYFLGRLRRRLGESGHVHIECADDGTKGTGTDTGACRANYNGIVVADGGVDAGGSSNVGNVKLVSRAIPVFPGWGERTVVITGSLYFAIATTQSVWMEVFPLWSVTNIIDGGLAFTQADIGRIYLVVGIAQILFSAWLYPPIARRFGPLLCFRAGFLLQIPLYVLLSFYSGIADNRVLLWPLLCVPFVLVQTFTVAVYTAVFQLISNSTVQERLGAANGVGQTFAALARVTGPLLGSFVLAWSESNGLPTPFDYHFLFVFILPLLCAGSVCLSCLLPRSIDPEYSRWCPLPGDQSRQTTHGRTALNAIAVKSTALGRATTESHGRDLEFWAADDVNDFEGTQETEIRHTH